MCAPNVLRLQDHPGQLWIFKCRSQDILEVFSFPLSNLGREPQAAFFQMTLMHLDRVFLLERCATCKCLQERRWLLSTRTVSPKLKASFAEVLSLICLNRLPLKRYTCAHTQIWKSYQGLPYLTILFQETVQVAKSSPSGFLVPHSWLVLLMSTGANNRGFLTLKGVGSLRPRLISAGSGWVFFWRLTGNKPQQSVRQGVHHPWAYFRLNSGLNLTDSPTYLLRGAFIEGNINQWKEEAFKPWAGIWLWDMLAMCGCISVWLHLCGGLWASVSRPVSRCARVSVLTPPSQDRVRHIQAHILSPSQVTPLHKNQSDSWAGLPSKNAQGNLTLVREAKENFYKTVATKNMMKHKAICILLLVEIQPRRSSLPLTPPATAMPKAGNACCSNTF